MSCSGRLAPPGPVQSSTASVGHPRGYCTHTSRTAGARYQRRGVWMSRSCRCVNAAGTLPSTRARGDLRRGYQGFAMGTRGNRRQSTKIYVRLLPSRECGLQPQELADTIASCDLGPTGSRMPCSPLTAGSDGAVVGGATLPNPRSAPPASDGARAAFRRPLAAHVGQSVKTEIAEVAGIGDRCSVQPILVSPRGP